VTMSEVANDFYKTYFISLLQDILGVLTDTFHKPGFRLQSLILAKLFNILETGAITVPLWVNAVSAHHDITELAKQQRGGGDIPFVPLLIALLSLFLCLLGSRIRIRTRFLTI
jgi:hypothetical protein